MLGGSSWRIGSEVGCLLVVACSNLICLTVVVEVEVNGEWGNGVMVMQWCGGTSPPLATPPPLPG